MHSYLSDDVSLAFLPAVSEHIHGLYILLTFLASIERNPTFRAQLSVRIR